MFGQSDLVNGIVAIFGAIGILAGAVAGAYVLVLRQRSVTRKDEIDGWRSLVESMSEQSERRENIMQGMQTVLELQQREHQHSRTVAVQLKSALYFLEDAYNRMYDAVSELGGHPGERLKLPPIDDLEETPQQAADFLSRQLQQDRQVVKEADKQIAQQKAQLQKSTDNANPAG